MSERKVPVTTTVDPKLLRTFDEGTRGVYGRGDAMEQGMTLLLEHGGLLTMVSKMAKMAERLQEYTLKAERMQNHYDDLKAEFEKFKEEHTP